MSYIGLSKRILVHIINDSWSIHGANNNEDIRNNSRISNQYAAVPKTLNEQDRKYMINKKQNH